MSKQDKPSIAVFVDVQNVYYTCRQAFGKQFNYRKLYTSLEKDYEIVLARAYAIESQNDGQHKFQTALKSIGFDIKLKPYLQREDGSSKGDWDVGIALDMVDKMHSVEHVMLLSGDGDFDLLMHYIRAQSQAKSHVLSVEKLSSYSLIKSCDKYQHISNEMLQ